MAPKKGENTRKRRRKARTEVTSSSDSSSGSSKSSLSPPDDRPATTNKDNDNKNSTSSSPAPSKASEPSPPATLQKQALDPEKAFEDFYLKQATKEFANDIDKLRSAPDFNERNVPILIRALRQGTACFGEGERRRVGGAAG